MNFKDTANDIFGEFVKLCVDFTQVAEKTSKCKAWRLKLTKQLGEIVRWLENWQEMEEFQQKKKIVRVTSVLDRLQQQMSKRF